MDFELTEKIRMVVNVVKFVSERARKIKTKRRKEDLCMDGLGKD